MAPTLQGRSKVHGPETLTQLALLQMARKTGAQVPGVCNTPTGIGGQQTFLRSLSSMPVPAPSSLVVARALSSSF